MKIVAGILTKNEDWCLKATIPAALDWCDEVVIYDDNSTDNSQEIIQAFVNEYKGRVFYYRNSEDSEFWDEMDKREELNYFVKAQNPNVFALVDADEILTVPLRTEIRSFLDYIKEDQVLALPMGCPWDNLEQIRVDHCSWTSCRWTTAIKIGQKELSWRPRDGYHHHNRVPPGITMNFMKNATSFNTHLQFANLPRRKSKHDYYKITELLRWGKTRPESSAHALNKKYGEAFNATGLKLQPMSDYYFKPGEKEKIDISSPGWYLEKNKELVQKYKKETFKELILHYEY